MKESEKYWYVSSKRMTFLIGSTNGIIDQSAPIGRKLIGQPLENIDKWMSKMGEYVRITISTSQ